jgi:hypothetical protein
MTWLPAGAFGSAAETVGRREGCRAERRAAEGREFQRPLADLANAPALPKAPGALLAGARPGADYREGG